MLTVSSFECARKKTRARSTWGWEWGGERSEQNEEFIGEHSRFAKRKNFLKFIFSVPSSHQFRFAMAPSFLAILPAHLKRERK